MNGRTRTVSVAFELIATPSIPVGRDPRSIALAPDGTIWVTARMSDEVPGTTIEIVYVPSARTFS